MQIILNCPGQGADAKTGKQVPVHASINASLLSMTGTVFLGGEGGGGMRFFEQNAVETR